jgi:hypothetical protein
VKNSIWPAVSASLLIGASTFANINSFAQTQQPASTQETAVVSRAPQAIALLQSCVSAMGSPAANLTVQAQGTATPLAKGGPVAQITLSSKGISSLRIDSVSQMPSGKTLTDSLIYGNGRGRWTHDQHYQSHSYPAARYSHPQLLPLLLCSVPLVRQDLSLEMVAPDAGDPPNTAHLQSFVDMRNASGKTDQMIKRMSQLDVYLNVATSLPASAKSFSFDVANLFNTTIWQTDYESYQTIQGIKVPMTVTETLESLKTRTIHWTSVTLDSGLDVAIFDTEAN